MKSILMTMTLTVLILSACQTETPRLDAQLGKSVAQMIQAQTLDPRTAANPAPLAPEGADGPRLKNVLDAHRKDVPVGVGSTEVSKAPRFGVGNEQQ